MSDVIQVAINRRARLKTELNKVEAFLQMAEEFKKDNDPDAGLTLAKSSAPAPAPKQPEVERTRPMSNGAARA